MEEKQANRPDAQEMKAQTDITDLAPDPSNTIGGQAPRSEPGAFVGNYIQKVKDPSISGALGKVMSYDCASCLYGVLYDDGHRENLDPREVSEILMADDGGANMKLSCRKRKLDLLVPVEDTTTHPKSKRSKDEEDYSDGTSHSRDSDVPDNADSELAFCSATSCEVSIPFPTPPPLPLPPSSGDINVPEESIAYLFSVYNFLRSFSRLLFLSPFGLDDFVGSLHCNVQNTLLDAVHLSLMRALRRHLELLSSEGSEQASKCLRCQDWTLLDSLTWPVFLVEYLYVMGYMKALVGEGSIIGFLNKEYYCLSVTTKLKVLQILCDGVMESTELKTELETREDMDEEKEHNIAVLPPQSGPRRLHPRYSKTSACKDAEALKNSVQPNKPESMPKVVQSDADADAMATAADGNSDECWLCGMDGMLICCDGCPSAYHSRCIGLNKASLPDGLWFCPECAVNKTSLRSSKVGRGIRGAEIFGIDPYERVFLGTCNYLLVCGISPNAEAYMRYYNQDDITKVLNAISFTMENASMYADISSGISKYWQIAPCTMVIGDTPLLKEFSSDFPICATLVNETKNTYDDGDNSANVVARNVLDNKGIICQKEDGYEGVVNSSNLSADQYYLRDLEKQNLVNHDLCWKAQNVHVKHEKSVSFTPANSHKQLGNGTIETDVPDTKHGSTKHFAHLSIRTRGNGSSICGNIANKAAFSTESQVRTIYNTSKRQSQTHGEKIRLGSDKSSRAMAIFKPHDYVNQYALGDVAAYAAANLNALDPEYSMLLEARGSSNNRKISTAQTAMQLKAFSAACVCFMWPNSEKKFVEVPRERCGWCLACKGSTTNKKGCLLNLVASNATKGSAKYISGLRSTKHEEIHLSVIATHISCMEESLHGLLIGSLLGMDYNKQWHKLLRETTNCRILKFLLLELERNIRGIALFGSWNKLVDDGSIEFSAAPTTMPYGPNKKRGPTGRWNKKLPAVSDLVSVPSEESWEWWRGGKILKSVLQKWALPGSLIKRAARQGGCRRISGICYPEGSEFPRRSRQLAWRASVEMCKTASQLALQVRYLDAHVRWRDLVRQDQLLDGKGSDVDAFVFRNAVICDKKITGNKILYALTFLNQKHLPLRVTRNIVEEEKTNDEKDKIWFSEIHVPLYLIKEYEEKAGLQYLHTVKASSHWLPKFQKKRMRSYMRDVFLYLLHKREKPSMSSCASCQQDVLFRDAVRCNACQGYCHKDCTIFSTAETDDDLEFLFTCNSCSRTLSGVNKIGNDMLGSQDHLPMVTKPMLQIGLHTSVSVGMSEVYPKMMTSASTSNPKRKTKRGGLCLTNGLIWKRKKGDESGKDFRLENIILRSKEGMVSSKQPTCSLCKGVYRPDLMYIRCEKCQSWFHADAVHLEESQIFDLLGFKCCKCRRKTSPKCPYVDPDYKRPDAECLKQETSVTKVGTICKANKLSALEPAMVSLPKVEDLVILDDPLLHSVGRDEPAVEQALGPEVKNNGFSSMLQNQQIKHEMGVDCFSSAPLVKSNAPTHSVCLQKLPVRRNDAKQGTDKEFSIEEEINFMTTLNSSSAHVEWGSSIMDGHADVASGVDFLENEISEDTEYEPQTYFSFTELLATEDGEWGNLLDVPSNVTENWYPPVGAEDIESLQQEPVSCDSFEYNVADEPVLDVVPCQKCKLNLPYPDLTCESCGLQIHSHCSPWVESEVPSAKWRCGSCRDWR
ncbi:putative transcription factor interactor and regulator LIM family [Dioscorea sansibarensis]